MKGLAILVTVGIVVFACRTREGSGSQKDDISGTYVREYSFEVVNSETGVHLGMRTIWDTIFIQSISIEYEVSNKKWERNDYDNEGWQSMEHADDRPMPSFRGAFSATDNSLRPQQDGLRAILYFVADKSALQKGKSEKSLYSKVKIQ